MVVNIMLVTQHIHKMIRRPSPLMRAILRYCRWPTLTALLSAAAVPAPVPAVVNNSLDRIR